MYCSAEQEMFYCQDGFSETKPHQRHIHTNTVTTFIGDNIIIIVGVRHNPLITIKTNKSRYNLSAMGDRIDIPVDSQDYIRDLVRLIVPENSADMMPILYKKLCLVDDNYLDPNLNSFLIKGLKSARTSFNAGVFVVH